MPLTNHISRLQWRFKKVYEAQARTDAPSPTSLIPFLYIPIQERLILLALLDGATLPEIKAALPFAKETDIRKSSPRMIAAGERLNYAIKNHWCWIEPGPLPTDEPGDLVDTNEEFPYPAAWLPEGTDRQLRKIFYASSAIMLFGDVVPSAIARLSLQARAILYLQTVEEYRWLDIQELLGCTEWKIRFAIKGAEEALGGK